MIRLLRHMMFVAIVALPSLVLHSCGLVYDDYGTADEDTVADGKMATLVLHIGLVAATRAGDTPANELMHSLRVVLLDENGTVEYNEIVDSNRRPDIFDAGGMENFDYSQLRLIRTTPGQKRIFLIANEENVTVSGGTAFDGRPLTEALGSKRAGDGGFGELAGSICFVPDAGSARNGNIVLSSVYDFTVGEEYVGQILERTFWLVRAATKYDVTFKNYRNYGVTVNKIEISSVSENMYLMAHVGDSDMYKELDGESAYWVDWLRVVAEATNDNPDNPQNDAVNRSYGWITDYDVPDAGNGHTASFSVGGWIDAVGAPVDEETDPAKEVSFGPFYAAEGNREDADYKIRFTLTDEKDGVAREFEGNLSLKALFRNTHVKANVELTGDNKIELNVMLTPWDNVTSGNVGFH